MTVQLIVAIRTIVSFTLLPLCCQVRRYRVVGLHNLSAHSGEDISFYLCWESNPQFAVT
jgi:hypothetical protein